MEQIQINHDSPVNYCKIIIDKTEDGKNKNESHGITKLKFYGSMSLPVISKVE